MKLHCFVCASPLYPDDPTTEERLHSWYAKEQISSIEGQDIQLTFIQNGCEFSTQGFPFIRNPFPKNIAYNWLLCDYNCQGDYWMFLPEDCRVLPQGWSEVRKREGRSCFSLSKDPKAIIAQVGIFRRLPSEIQALCDMNFLGKELACAILRGELDKNGFHCITPNWRRISDQPRRWGNELYEEINHPDHPYDVNKTRRLPILQDYGLDGFKAKSKAIDAALMKIVDQQLVQLREYADRGKGVISKYGPVLTELPCKI